MPYTCVTERTYNILSLNKQLLNYDKIDNVRMCLSNVFQDYVRLSPLPGGWSASSSGLVELLNEETGEWNYLAVPYPDESIAMLICIEIHLNR